MTFQDRVNRWCQEAFGTEITCDKQERYYRFLEEALELVQACGCPKDDALKLVDYVYDRSVGEPSQEVGGVIITLHALCNALHIGVSDAGELELARCWRYIEKIRAKQASKEIRSPLPGVSQ